MSQEIRICTLLACLLLGSSALAQHTGDMLIGSSVDRGGRLAIDYDFTRKVRVTFNLSGGGMSFYSGTDPGFDALATTTSGLFPLRSNTTVSFRLVQAETGVSVKIGDTTVDAAGESATIGTSPNLHEHPQWRLLLPDGVAAERKLVFRLTTTSRSYEESVDYTVVVSNLTTDATPSPTPSPTASASPTIRASATVTPSLTARPTSSFTAEPSHTPTSILAPPTSTSTPSQTATLTVEATPSATPFANLDANCDRRIGAADIVAVARSLGGERRPCSADTNGDGSVDLQDVWVATQAPFSLR